MKARGPIEITPVQSSSPVPVVALTPASCGAVLWRAQGAERLTVVVKATFALVHDGDAQLAAPADLILSDRLRDGWGSLEEASETAPYLPCAGVLVRGHAAAPAGTSATVEATLQNGNTVSGGNVAFIENSVDPQTGTILVRALFDNRDETLWPGTLASVRVTLRTDKNAVTVPNEAVQTGQRGSFVFVIENGAAKVHDVTVARTAGGESVISKGLNGGETVVTVPRLELHAMVVAES